MSFIYELLPRIHFQLPNLAFPLTSNLELAFLSFSGHLSNNQTFKKI